MLGFVSTIPGNIGFTSDRLRLRWFVSTQECLRTSFHMDVFFSNVAMETVPLFIRLTMNDLPFQSRLPTTSFVYTCLSSLNDCWPKEITDSFSSPKIMAVGKNQIYSHFPVKKYDAQQQHANNAQTTWKLSKQMSHKTCHQSKAENSNIPNSKSLFQSVGANFQEMTGPNFLGLRGPTFSK